MNEALRAEAAAIKAAAERGELVDLERLQVFAMAALRHNNLFRLAHLVQSGGVFTQLRAVQIADEVLGATTGKRPLPPAGFYFCPICETNRPLTEPCEHISIAEGLRPLVIEMVRASEPQVQSCRVCGCTDADCSGCIERTGQPCHWVSPDLCSACVSAGAAWSEDGPRGGVQWLRGVVDRALSKLSAQEGFSMLSASQRTAEMRASIVYAVLCAARVAGPRLPLDDDEAKAMRDRIVAITT